MQEFKSLTAQKHKILGHFQPFNCDKSGRSNSCYFEDKVPTNWEVFLGFESRSDDDQFSMQQNS